MSDLNELEKVQNERMSSKEMNDLYVTQHTDTVNSANALQKLAKEGNITVEVILKHYADEREKMNAESIINH